LVNSTEIAAHLDPEEWRDILGRYQQVVADAVVRFEGHVAQYLGDGVLALFGYPVAHENDAERAVRTGLDIIEGVTALNAGLDAKGLPALAARVGIHAGPVVVGASDNKSANVFGDAPNIAARIQVAAEPNTVVVSGAVHKLVFDRFVVEDRGTQTLKGISRPVQLYCVTQPAAGRRGGTAAASRALAPLVGREEETRLLFNRWEQAREGHGQVVLVVGEPGIGKSRLVEEFHARIKDDRHLWVEGAGEQSFANTPFHALFHLVAQILGWRPDESAKERVSHLEGALEHMQMNLGEAVPLIAEMLNLPIPEKYPPLLFPPDQKRKRLMANLAEWMINVTQMQPVVIWIEDLQWVDPSTLELINTLVEQSATLPLMVLSTARPEFRAPWPMHAHHTQITLGRLRDRDVRGMVHAVAAKTTLTEEMVDAITNRSSGVPLFVEELTRAVVESGGRGATGDIPGTLHNSLIARLDRLGAAREIAQVASVIGREFSYHLLSAISPVGEGELQSALSQLALAELIYARGMPPEARYQFKHALIRDAAYDALLKTRRRELHRRVAQALTEKFSALADAQHALVAQHWTEAGESQRATDAWEAAARSSAARGALKEAEFSLRSALANLKSLPEQRSRDSREFEILANLAVVLNNTRGYGAPETAEVTARAREVAEKTGDLESLSQQTTQTWLVAVGRAQWKEAQAIADDVWDIGCRAGTRRSMLYAYNVQQVSRHWSGDLVGSNDYIVRAIDYFRKRDCDLVEMNPTLYLYASLNLWPMGFWDQARNRMRQAFASKFIASQGKEANTPMVVSTIPMTQATVFIMATALLAHSRDMKETETMALKAMAMCDDFGMPALSAVCRTSLGRARAGLGRSAEGVALIREGVRVLTDTVTRLGLTSTLTWLAEAELLNGEISEAQATIEKAISENPQEGVSRPEAFRMRGELFAIQKLKARAETDFREAIALSQRMSAKLLELRAAVSLARLLRDTNRRDGARAVLAEIYGWFTEGFDTADLKDAKALLDELSNSPC
jgi:class 3 adenylate cyclase/tetratricopeptide (TPR) repeat protein